MELDRYSSDGPDRDYHYRVPRNAGWNYRRALWALHEMVHYRDRLVAQWKEFTGHKPDYLGLKTYDGKGHLEGLEQYAYSPRWESGPRLCDINEIRNANNGGSKIRGLFTASPEPHCEIKLQFDTTIPHTPTEVFDAWDAGGEDWYEIQKLISGAKDKAIEEYQTTLAESRRNCDHETLLTPPSSSEATPVCCDKCGKVFEDHELTNQNLTPNNVELAH